MPKPQHEVHKPCQKLSREHYELLLKIVNGADIVGYYEAGLLRDVGRLKPEYVTITGVMGSYSVREKLPYFGAITSGEGKRAAVAFLKKPARDRIQERKARGA